MKHSLGLENRGLTCACMFGTCKLSSKGLSKHKEKEIHRETYAYAATHLGEQGNWGTLRHRWGWTWTVVDWLCAQTWTTMNVWVRESADSIIVYSHQKRFPVGSIIVIRKEDAFHCASKLKRCRESSFCCMLGEKRTKCHSMQILQW